MLYNRFILQAKSCLMYTQDILGESILKSTITHTNIITGPSDNNDIINSVTGVAQSSKMQSYTLLQMYPQ